MKRIGPFHQLLTMDHMPASGPVRNDQLEVIENAGILVRDGVIAHIGLFDDLENMATTTYELPRGCVGLPGFIDSHTHICYAGRRAQDYCRRLNGDSYLEIAKDGGGIQRTVQSTRAANQDSLQQNLLLHLQTHLQQGVTSCEIKSGYGLNQDSELKILRAIHAAQAHTPIRLTATCLAAHICPKEFESARDYLQNILENILPLVIKEKLSNRVDIFIEDSAFTAEDGIHYLNCAKAMGFSLVVHADQFSRGGSHVAATVGALSADHLEASTDEDFRALKTSGVIPIVLPGACLGLGLDWPQARSILDHDLPLVIASDWNPGSAPMGNLLLQAALLGCQQKLSAAETFAAITCRAAKALEIKAGVLSPGFPADILLFPTEEYQDILYRQGALQPSHVFIAGELAYDSHTSGS